MRFYHGYSSENKLCGIRLKLTLTKYYLAFFMVRKHLVHT